MLSTILLTLPFTISSNYITLLLRASILLLALKILISSAIFTLNFYLSEYGEYFCCISCALLKNEAATETDAFSLLISIIWSKLVAFAGLIHEVRAWRIYQTPLAVFSNSIFTLFLTLFMTDLSS